MSFTLPLSDSTITVADETYIMSILKQTTDCQNKLIINNNQAVIHESSGFSSRTALDTIMADEDDEVFSSNRYECLRNDKCEAYRLLKPYWARLEIYRAIQKVGTNRRIVAKELHVRYIDQQLIDNLSRMDDEPELPRVCSARLMFSEMANQMIKDHRFVRATSQLILTHVSIGKRRFDFTWNHLEWLKKRYSKRALCHISKPTFQVVPKEPYSYSIAYNKKGDAYVAQQPNPVTFNPVTDKVIVTFTVMMTLPKARKAMNHVAAFDLGMDTTKPMCGVRMSSNGWVSRELGLSHVSKLTNHHLLETQRQLGFVLKKITNLTNHHLPINHNLTSIAYRLYQSITRRKDALDWQVAHDCVASCKPDDVLIMEFLKWSGGGSVKFRHGSVQDKVKHLAAKSRVRIVEVNPAYTSQSCAKCGGQVKHKNRLNTCPACGFTLNRDYSAAINIGRRGLEKIHHPLINLLIDHCYSSHGLHQPKRRCDKSLQEKASYLNTKPKV